MHFFAIACSMFLYLIYCAFPGPDHCDQFKLLYFVCFWNSAWYIPGYMQFSLFLPTTFLHIDAVMCDANLQGRKGSLASCGGVEAWQFLGWKQQWMALFYSVAPNILPSIWAGGLGCEGGTVGVCMCSGKCSILPSRSPPSTTLQK